VRPPAGSGIGVRVRAWFVAPARAPAPETIGVDTAYPSVAVLASGDDAAALGAAIGIALARAGRTPCALVLSWSGPGEPVGGWAAPATLGARRLAARLADRGHDAMATGRLARVELPAEESAAAVEAQRIMAAGGGVPIVLTVAGPRGAALSALVGGQDHVLVFAAPGAPAGLADLALVGLPADRASAHVVAVGRVARALAQAGVAVAPGLRAPMLTAARAVV